MQKPLNQSTAVTRRAGRAAGLPPPGAALGEPRRPCQLRSELLHGFLVHDAAPQVRVDGRVRGRACHPGGPPRLRQRPQGLAVRTLQQQRELEKWADCFAEGLWGNLTTSMLNFYTSPPGPRRVAVEGRAISPGEASAVEREL